MADESNVYSFTTTEDDPYLDRVLDEAEQDVDFILTTEKHTLHGDGNYATLTFRKSVASIALMDANLTLGRRTLGEWLESIIEAAERGDDTSAWAEVQINGTPEEIEEELVNLRNEINRLKNIIQGRVVRVKVESF